jgi:hypothetical protein
MGDHPVASNARRQAREVSSALDRAIAAEARSQTPPNGDDSPYYFCPACGVDRTTRGEIRSHLTACAGYRAFVDASVRRADLEEVPI